MLIPARRQISIDRLARLRSRVSGAIRMITVFFSLEIAAQGCAALGSLLVVHNMDKQHYAWYCLAHNLQGTLGLFTQMGIGAGLISMGSQYLNDRLRMGALAASAIRYRRVLLAGASPVALPIFGYLLLKNGCPVWHTALLLLLALAVLNVEFSRQVLSTPVRLCGRYNLLQRAALLESVLRTGVLGLLILASGLNATTTLVASVLVSAYVVHRVIGKAARVVADPHAAADRGIGRQLTRMNLNLLPPTLSAVFQAQIGMAMISLFGKTAAVADLGALTRIGLVPAIPQAMLSKVVEPKLSRAQAGSDLWTKSLLALGLALTMTFATFGFILIFSHQMLWLLGPNYSSLHRELLWFGAISCARIVTGVPQMVLYARGWVQYLWIPPLVEIVSQGIAIPFLDLSHPLGVLWLEAVRSTVSFMADGTLLIRQWLLWRRRARNEVTQMAPALPACTPRAGSSS